MRGQEQTPGMARARASCVWVMGQVLTQSPHGAPLLHRWKARTHTHVPGHSESCTGGLGGTTASGLRAGFVQSRL